MITVAVQSPLPVTTLHAERPALHSIETRTETAVNRLPDDGVTKVSAGNPHPQGQPALRKMLDETTTKGDAAEPAPFPDLHFPDPLPELPELDLPAKTEAYQTALHILR